MMNIRHAHRAWVLCGMLLAGCVSVPPLHFYTLLDSPAPARADAAPQHAAASITVESVHLPEAVDRAELVVRTGAHSVAILENQLWAEPPKSMIARAIADDLGAQLGTTVSVRDDYASANAQYRVWVDITRFDSTPGEAAEIEAIWSVKSVNNPANSAGTTGSDVIKSGSATFRIPLQGTGYDALVAAHATALAALSEKIAAQFRETGAANGQPGN